MNGIDKVFVLHVKKGYEDREKHMNAELQKFGIDFEYLLDYDIPDLSEDIINNYYNINHELDKPNLSIGMKHIEVLNKIVENGYSKTLVFEDDVFLDKSFHDIMKNVMNELQDISDGYVVSLGNAGNSYVAHNRLESGKFLYSSKKHRAADSYLLDFEAAKRRLKYLQEHKTVQPAGHMYNIIDNKVGNKIFWLSPTIVEQGSQNGLMRSSVSRNKFLHKYRWLWRDFNKKYLHRLKLWK